MRRMFGFYNKRQMGVARANEKQRGPGPIESLEARLLFADVTAPLSQLSSAAAHNPWAQSYVFNVTYTDNVAVSAATVDSDDIIVYGPSSISQYATLVNARTLADGGILAQYAVTAPPLVGTYSINMLSTAVADTSGNTVVGGQLGTFIQDPPDGGDTTDTIPPNATLSAGPNRSSDGSTYTFDITYTDDTDILQETIDSQDVRVIGANGSFNQAATLVSVTPNSTSSVVGHYSISAPATVGTYNFTVQAGQVSDSAGNTVPNSLVSIVTLLPQSYNGGGGGSGSGGTDVIPKFVNPDLVVSVVGDDQSGGTFATGVVGERDRLDVRLSNLGNTATTRRVRVRLYASTGQTLTDDDTLLATKITNRLYGGQTRVNKLKFTWPSLAAGQYYIIAQVDPYDTIAEDVEVNNFFTSQGRVNVVQPTADLSAAILSTTPAAGGDFGTSSVLVTNVADSTFDRGIDIALFASTDAVLDGGDVQIGTLRTRPATLAAGASKAMVVNYAKPAGLADGNYFVMARVQATPVVNDVTPANNVGISSVPVSIGSLVTPLSTLPVTTP